METNYNIGEKYHSYNKILIFGDKSVGKSTFVKRIGNIDFESAYVPSNCKMQ